MRPLNNEINFVLESGKRAQYHVIIFEQTSKPNNNIGIATTFLILVLDKKGAGKQRVAKEEIRDKKK